MLLEQRQVNAGKDFLFVINKNLEGLICFSELYFLIIYRIYLRINFLKEIFKKKYIHTGLKHLQWISK